MTKRKTYTTDSVFVCLRKDFNVLKQLRYKIYKYANGIHNVYIYLCHFYDNKLLLHQEI